jgi:hypothetical protein
MIVVTPKEGKWGYYKKHGLMYTAPIFDRKLDRTMEFLVEYFELDEDDFLEAMVALDLLDKHEEHRKHRDDNNRD